MEPMRKSISIAALIFAAATIASGAAHAQQQGATPANTKPSAQDKTPPAANAAKPGAANPDAASPSKPPVPPELPTEKDRFSYALGMNIAEYLHRIFVGADQVDPALITRGIKDSLTGKTLFTEQDARATLTEASVNFRKQYEEANKAFLESNKTKEGVVALPSGLQYKVLQASSGPKPTASDTVECLYRGTFIDGTEFDSSARHGGTPATFPVTGVIKGWTEALQLMPAGSKWQIFVPSELAYGPAGKPPAIAPNSTLIFEVELVSIKEKPQPKPEEKPAMKPEEKPAEKPKTE
jgi:FKBP-type peptidyl-prolyl cis-trans isomerase FklB